MTAIDNTIARRVTAANAIMTLVPGEHAAARRGPELEHEETTRLNRLLEQIGRLGTAILKRDDEAKSDALVRIAGIVHAWIDHLQAEAAR
jgi:hypothetical protein